MKSLMHITTLTIVLGFITWKGFAQQYPQMVTVTGDTFKMGKEVGLDLSEERAVHKAIVSTFKIAKTEVTVLQWKKYCEETASPMPTAPSWGWNDDNPIVNISWEDAVWYCEWLSAEKRKEI